MLRGGKAIGSGARGCTFRPALPIKGKTKRPRNTVSKLLPYQTDEEQKYADGEVEANRRAANAVAGLDDKFKDFFIVGSDTLERVGDGVTADDVQNWTCPFLSDVSDKDRQTAIATDLYRVIQQRDGGETLWSILQTLHMRDAYYCLKLILNWCDTAQAVVELNKRQFMHGDLKPDNVVYDGEKLRVIDFDKLTTVQDWVDQNREALDKLTYPSPYAIQNLGVLLSLQDIKSKNFNKWVENELGAKNFQACEDLFNRLKPYFWPEPRMHYLRFSRYRDFMEYLLHDTMRFVDDAKNTNQNPRVAVIQTLVQYSLDAYGLMLMIVEVCLKIRDVSGLEPLHQLAEVLVRRFVFYLLHPAGCGKASLPLPSMLSFVRGQVETVKNSLPPPPPPPKSAGNDKGKVETVKNSLPPPPPPPKSAGNDKGKAATPASTTVFRSMGCAPRRRRRSARRTPCRSRRLRRTPKKTPKRRRAVRRTKRRVIRRTKTRAQRSRTRSTRRRRSKATRNKSRR